MAMDLERRDDGRMHFSLGPAEKWLAVLCGLALAGPGAWQVRSTPSLLIQAAVTNEQLRVLNAQATDWPELPDDVTALKVRVDSLEPGPQGVITLRSLKTGTWQTKPN